MLVFKNLRTIKYVYAIFTIQFSKSKLEFFSWFNSKNYNKDGSIVGGNVHASSIKKQLGGNLYFKKFQGYGIMECINKQPIPVILVQHTNCHIMKKIIHNYFIKVLY
jgi:hypothetical protein